MNAIELVEQLQHLTNPERLEIIEAATRLVREDLGQEKKTRASQDDRMRRAAERLRDLYAPGSEHLAWTALDAGVRSVVPS